MDAKKLQVGDEVMYTVQERAEVISIDGTTHVTIKVLTGPQKGQQFSAPRDKINSDG
jgi:hypothetical protein